MVHVQVLLLIKKIHYNYKIFFQGFEDQSLNHVMTIKRKKLICV